jgi:signal transduction histidine kinase
VTVTAYTQDTEDPEALDDAPELVLRVSDTGPGVDPEHAEAVFQRGFSTKPAGPGGRGLGLALVRQAVQRHEGTLSVSEADGGGAQFEVRLPLRESGAVAEGVTSRTSVSRGAGGYV